MRVTKINFRDMLTFSAISGILLLTGGKYLDSSGCRCPVDNRSPLPADVTGDEVETWLRHVLRDHVPPLRQPPVHRDEE
jgi:hypothetical protein